LYDAKEVNDNDAQVSGGEPSATRSTSGKARNDRERELTSPDLTGSAAFRHSGGEDRALCLG